MVAIRALNVAASCAITGYFVYKFVFLMRSTANWQLLSSLTVIIAARYYYAGRSEAMRELSGVVGDLARPFRLCARAAQMHPRDLYEQLLVALITFSCYKLMYGPFCGLFYICFVFPFTAVRTIGKLYISEYIGLFDIALWIALVVVFAIWFSMPVVIGAHRYFSHRSFATSRVGSFFLGIYTSLSGQLGPLWWASTHRRHHRHCETKLDPHCPGVQGFWYSHCLWVVNRDNFDIRPDLVRDWLNNNPELLVVDLLSIQIFVWGKDYICKFVLWALTTCGVTVSMEFIVMAAVVGNAIMHNGVWLLNSWLHSHDPPDGIDEEWPGVHWSAVNNGISTRPKTEVDVHGAEEHAKRKPCVGIDNLALGLWYGDGFHGRHHQNGRLAMHAPVWYLDYPYCIILFCERLGIVWNVQKDQKQR